MPGRPKPKLLSNWLGIIILILIHIRTHFPPQYHFIVPPISGIMYKPCEYTNNLDSQCFYTLLLKKKIKDFFL